jgi:ADP-ribosylglycohydrolase
LISFPADYIERVYAGVLGKLIGVYLGRPFEGWEYERIMAELGEINGYVHEKRGLPLVVTDDDISGTFTFVRALEDYAYAPDLTPAQIGQTWLNYLVEGKTILSWAGLGCSTEHTAYLRLKKGIQAPASGSIEMNGPIVAQQIGSQIFIDSWAMLFPGDPQRAADFAARAASVSHDGEAIYGAQSLAAMQAQAFVETDRFQLLDTALRFTPASSGIHAMIGDLRSYHAVEPDWRKAREFIVQEYGYQKYPGGCHIIPNHALIILGLLYGDDDFQKSLMIVNTSGWDTDCNSGNLGCLLGIKNGLAGIDRSPVAWREPVADRLYLPAADGGRAISDAVSETYYLVNTARRMAGETPLAPKGGARFHFELPGSVQGFEVEHAPADAQVTLQNRPGHSRSGQRSLCIAAVTRPDETVRVATPTFIPPGAIDMSGYGLLASPTLYAGQLVEANLQADFANSQPVTVQLYLNIYGPADEPQRVEGPAVQLQAGEQRTLRWCVPSTDRLPIYAIGLQLGTGTIFLDSLTWSGQPEVEFGQPLGTKSLLWRKGWINGVDHWEWWSGEPFRLVKNEGRGLVITGTRAWTNYCFDAVLRIAYLVKTGVGGIAVRVQGMQRYYALEVGQETIRLVKMLDGVRTLAEAPIHYELWEEMKMRLEVEDTPAAQRSERTTVQLRAWVNDRLLFDVQDADNVLTGGGVALLVEEGHILADHVSVRGVNSHPRGVAP